MPQSTASRQRSVYILAAVLAIAGVMASRLSAAAGLAGDNAGPLREVRVGIANHVKVGHWTQIRVGVRTELTPRDAKVAVTTTDNDGVSTLVTAPIGLQTNPDAEGSGVVYASIGMMGAPIHVSILEADKLIDTRTLAAGSTAANFVELSATAELLLFLGPMQRHLLDSHTRRHPVSGEVVRQAVRAEGVDELPEVWFGYDAVDLAVMHIGDGGPFDEYCRLLTASRGRYDALVRWIELGGRLVVFCGAQGAEALLSDGQPLATLLPGRLADVVRLPETGRLEYFAGSETPISSREAIRVPRLVDVTGKIELYEGRQARDLPLVVRTPRGFGEITFVAIDPTMPPFADWLDQKAFIDVVLRPYLEGEQSAAVNQKLVTRGYNDMSGALRQRLGRVFTSIRPIAFSLIIVLAVGYLLALGPLDYVVIQQWLKTAWAPWVTFPLIVILFGGLALGLSERQHAGGNLRFNQVELLDIDASSGHVRGTVWSAVYSPTADRLNLRLDVELPSGASGPEARMQSWALPGEGIGGTRSRGSNLWAGEVYRVSGQSAELIGVPILTAGTKSLLTRWTAQSSSLIDAKLTQADGLLTGSIENRTGRRLRNVRVYYGEWGYRLGTIADGMPTDVGDELRPLSFKTAVRQDSFGTSSRDQTEEELFAASRASLKEIVNVMMFYEAVGGFNVAQLQNRFQSYCDFSRLPMLGRAVLVADVDTPGSRLVSADSGAAIGEPDTTVIYRFVLPVRDEQP